jgi:hypothetical protein
MNLKSDDQKEYIATPLKVEKSLNGYVKKGKEIEEYLTKEITINEFFGGSPSYELMQRISKYNREILKAAL